MYWFSVRDMLTWTFWWRILCVWRVGGWSDFWGCVGMSFLLSLILGDFFVFWGRFAWLKSCRRGNVYAHDGVCLQHLSFAREYHIVLQTES